MSSFISLLLDATRQVAFKLELLEAPQLMKQAVLKSYNHVTQLWPLHSYLSLELICNALASILAPMSPIAFPLMSSLVSVELLPKALRTMVRSLLSLESARDREVRGWEGQDLTGTKGVCGDKRG